MYDLYDYTILFSIFGIFAVLLANFIYRIIKDNNNSKLVSKIMDSYTKFVRKMFCDCNDPEDQLDQLCEFMESVNEMVKTK